MVAANGKDIVSQSVTPTDVLQARRRLLGLTYVTPCVRSTWLSRKIGRDVYLKLENVQITGSFKVRGALNKLQLLTHLPKGSQVLAVSAGNHGLAVAYGANLFGLSATVIAPRSAPQSKIKAIMAMGAKLRLVGGSYDEAEREALRVAAKTRVPFISPYNDVDVIAGQGTIALELFEQVPDVDAIVLPVGGGGLLAGVAVMAKAFNASIKVIGVQPENSPAMHDSLRTGHVVTVKEKPTLADGLAGNLQQPSLTFPLIRQYVDEIRLVSEKHLRQAIVELVASERLIVEAAGAAPIAMLIANRSELRSHKIVVVLTGRNIDFPVLRELLLAKGR